METFYLFLVIFLFVLAIVDLSVGVSNDAVNFLSSAIGSRAASFHPFSTSLFLSGLLLNGRAAFDTPYSAVVTGATVSLSSEYSV